MPLKHLREDIDKIDTKIADLFAKRMGIAAQIAGEKKDTGTPLWNIRREKEILSRISDQVGDALGGYARILYNTMFDVSRSYQTRFLYTDSPLKNEIDKAISQTPALFPKKAVVACQGIEGSYSQLAAEKLFEFPSIMYFNNWDSVFNAVDKGLCQYGVLPIENSSYGSVGPVYDLMKNHHFYIAKAFKLRIAHKLLAKPGIKLEDITEIISHDQALGQCSPFIEGLKDVKITSCDNTAMAAELVANSQRKDLAAISSKECAELYGLEVLSEDIQISDNNYTRFICISKNLEIYPGANKLSLMISVPHRPSSLYNMIAKFASLGLNLTKLESRPIPGSDFEFMFYFDMEASLQSPEVISLLCELSAQPELFVFLGNYTEN
ncbi:bifunctional chorismate mutase/prephenate dehydratase [Aminipila butyrica]|uniref:Bifunctional chorismate mutase/prephenate dehydratase n=1 Tax=Aminipila butyrica TaxID=433296 RepID=A0A858BR92_9FIRM|nr:bifunctional chorismate mutase/prephenate dehydratase [Aminipila butyrica]QIB68047.1 bifunctional chorismate mutase/prephenate dehydratase [Aminipila butyrica]